MPGGADEPTPVKGTDTGTDADVTPNTVWNVARLQTGMTQVLVAPSLRTPQGQARPSPPSCGPAEQHEDEGAAGDQADGTHSQTLELRLEADSEAGTAADESDPHVPSEAEEDQATGLQSKDSDPAEEEEGAAAGAEDDNSDAQSVLSDGADSYQGLPPETLAHLAASANESQSDAHGDEEAERDAAAAGQAACGQATGEDERRLPHDALEPTTAAQTDQGGREEEQQLPQDALEPCTAAQTDPGARAQHRDNHRTLEEEQLQPGDTVMEEQQSELHMAADDELAVVTAGPPRTSPAQALSSSEGTKWQAGAEIEVHCSDEPQVWSWRPATLISQHFTEEFQVQVRWKLAFSPVPRPPEMVEVPRLRPVAPIETHIAQTDMPPRGSVLEVDCGDHGGGYKCAVLVGRRRSSPTSKQRDLDSMVHAILPGTHPGLSILVRVAFLYLSPIASVDRPCWQVLVPLQSSCSRTVCMSRWVRL